MSVKPAAPLPISAGIQPELDRISSTASMLLKLENVEPPISGIATSAVHCKCGFHATLTIDGKLLREVRGAIRIGSDAPRREQEPAEVVLVKSGVYYCLTG